MSWSGRFWRGMFILISVGASSGPAFAEKPLAQLSTEKLCDSYGDPSHQRFMRPDVAEELVRREASYCLDREYIAAKQEARVQRQAREQEGWAGLQRMGESLQKCGRVSC